MSSEVIKLVTFADHIPATANPFSATATFFEDVIKGTVSSSWTRLMAKICIAGFGLMFFQALYLLFQRLRLSTISTVRSNKLGLLTFNQSDVATVIYILYALLNVTVFSAELAVQRDVRFEGLALFIFQCKFAFILILAWTYLWACVCRCAELFWESDRVTNLSSRNQETLRLALKWAMSLSILSVALVPIPISFWAASMMFISFSKILAIIWKIKADLLVAASSYNPATYTKVQLLTFFIPAQNLPPALSELEKYVSFMTGLYVLLLTLWIAIYIPSLFFSLRCLYKRLVLQAAKDTALDPRGKSPPSTMSRKIRRQANQLVYHALSVFLCVLVHYPVLIWLARNQWSGFIANQKWRIVCYYGLSVPFSITGNVVLATLNSHSRDLLRERHKLRSGDSNGTFTHYRESTLKVDQKYFKQLWSFGTNSQDRDMGCDAYSKEISLVPSSANALKAEISLTETTHAEEKSKVQAPCV